MSSYSCGQNFLECQFVSSSQFTCGVYFSSVVNVSASCRVACQESLSTSTGINPRTVTYTCNQVQLACKTRCFNKLPL